MRLAQLAPAALVGFDAKRLGSCLDALPGLVPFGIGDVLDPVEARDRVADAVCVLERLLALLGKRELPVRELVAIPSIQLGHGWSLLA